MSDSVRFKGVYPIGETDPNALPVDALAPALSFYTDSLGFVVTLDATSAVPSATLVRDRARITLVENGGDPEQASCYFEVSDVAAFHRSLSDRDLDLGPLEEDTHNGVRYRLFFLRAPDRLCYCIGQELR